MTEAIILAGGFGTRLREVVNDRPKPMAPIGDRPFLAILLDYLADQGVSRVVLSVGYQRQSIIDFFGDRHGPTAVSYAVEETPLGTGGAIRNALRQVTRDLIWVLNGDSFLALDYRAMLRAHRAAASSSMSMALRRVTDTARYGSVSLGEGGRIVGFAPTGTTVGGGLINSGVYLLSPDLFRGEARQAFSFERDFLPEAVSRHRILGHVTDAWFIDIGVPEDYRRAGEELPAIVRAV